MTGAVSGSARLRGLRLRHRRSERGVALLLVLWIFVVLFVVVLDFASSMRDDGLATANFADETQAYYIALGGLNRAVYDVLLRLEEDPDAFSGDDLDDEDDEDAGDTEGDDEEDEDDDGGDDNDFSDAAVGDGQWYRDSFGGGSYAVRIIDESGKISLNRAEPPLLERVVRAAVVGGSATEGVGTREQEWINEVVAAIIDWRDPDDLNYNHQVHAEADYYLSLPRPYPIKNGPFDSVDELLLVRGVTPDLFYGSEGKVGLGSVFSVFTRSRRVNLLRAPAPVLRVLCRLDQEAAEQLIAQREEDRLAFVEQMKADCPEMADVLGGGRSSLVTVEARGRIGEHERARVAAVVDLSDSFEGARVFRWFDRVPAGWETAGAPAAGEQDEGTGL